MSGVSTGRVSVTTMTNSGPCTPGGSLTAPSNVSKNGLPIGRRGEMAGETGVPVRLGFSPPNA
eukprot:189808-Lingulodinium_polyedra.AAC.1